MWLTQTLHIVAIGCRALVTLEYHARLVHMAAAPIAPGHSVNVCARLHQ